MFVCLFVSRTLWVLVRRLWQSYSSLLRLPKYQHNKLTIYVVLQTNQVLCPLAHSICRNTSITDCDLTLERLQLETKMIHTNATKWFLFCLVQEYNYIYIDLLWCSLSCDMSEDFTLEILFNNISVLYFVHNMIVMV